MEHLTTLIQQGRIMESLTLAFITIGILSTVFTLIAYIYERAIAHNIREPEYKSFTHIRRFDNLYRTISVPSIAALLAGWVSSCSSSILYDGLPKEGLPKDEQPTDTLAWRLPVSILILLLALSILAIAITRAIGKSIGLSDLAKHPVTIRAAANEYQRDASDAQVSINELEDNLAEWRGDLCYHSLSIPIRFRAKQNNKGPTTPSKYRATSRKYRATSRKPFGWLKRGFPNRHEKVVERLNKAVKTDIHYSDLTLVYISALAAFPFRFMWPIVGFAILSIGTFLSSFDFSGQAVSAWYKSPVSLIILTVIALAIMLIYCTARANNARRLHRVNIDSIEAAENALEEAKCRRGCIDKSLLSWIEIQTDR